VPSSQLVHDVVDPSPAFPAVHRVQAASTVDEQVLETKEPTLHTLQVAQEAWPGLGWKEFEEHAEQSSAEPVLNDPAVQSSAAVRSPPVFATFLPAGTVVQ
jgi:hypothetical protein